MANEITVEFHSHMLTELNDYNVNIIKRNNDQLLAVTTTDRVFHISEDFSIEEKGAPIKNIQDVDVYLDVIVWVSRGGMLSFTEGDEETYRFHV